MAQRLRLEDLHVDETCMSLAREVAKRARHRSAPNPWVGAVLVQIDGKSFSAATGAHGEAHAEVAVLRKASNPKDATIFTTLEPCNHWGKTGPCTEALIDAGIKRVVIAQQDPDSKVAGSGIKRLRQANVDVTLGVGAAEVERQLRPYLHQRRSGVPWVVLKLAATLDGQTAARDSTSKWLTGMPARIDAHQIRAHSCAIVVGANTVRLDDPSLTVRYWPQEGSRVNPAEVTDPYRVVLGSVPENAKVKPCLSWHKSPEELLAHLAERGAIQVMVEGGSSVAHSFHQAGLVNQYVLYLAAALMGGNDGAPMLRGTGAAGIKDLSRMKIENVHMLGEDLRVDLIPRSA